MHGYVAEASLACVQLPACLPLYLVLLSQYLQELHHHPEGCQPLGGCLVVAGEGIQSGKHLQKVAQVGQYQWMNSAGSQQDVLAILLYLLLGVNYQHLSVCKQLATRPCLLTVSYALVECFTRSQMHGLISYIDVTSHRPMASWPIVLENKGMPSTRLDVTGVRMAWSVHAVVILRFIHEINIAVIMSDPC